jgi:predicted transcriptional regulator
MNEFYNKRVSELMSKGVISISEDATVREAARVLMENKISGVMVVDKDSKPVGVLSEIDIAVAVKEGEVGAPVRDYMSREVHAIMPESSLRDVAKIMSEKGIHRLFVYPDKKGRVGVKEMPLGIISSRDIILGLSAHSRSK